MLREGNIELLTSAIGHEFIHVARRDYLLNLIYELLFVPLSFHPSAALLRRRVKQTRKLLLVAASLLLLVPCVAAAALSMRFDVDTKAQEPAAQDKERKEKEKVEMKLRESGEEREMKERMERNPQFREERERKERIEMEMREVRQAALVRLAKINMDQAIQIATSQQPGKELPRKREP